MFKKIAKVGDIVTWVTSGWSGPQVMQGAVRSISKRGKDPKCEVEVSEKFRDTETYIRKLSELTVKCRARGVAGGRQ